MFSRKNNFYKMAGTVFSGATLGLCLSQSAWAEGLQSVEQETPIHVASASSNVADIKIRKKGLTAEVALTRATRILKKAKTPDDHRIAFQYFKYAAEQGLAEAQFQCAVMYLDDQYAPAGDEEALHLLEKASMQGHKQAGIALNYIQNEGEDGFGC